LGGAETAIQDVSDTAYWVAALRARESERPDALFRDPFAGMLAGDRGRQIAAKMGGVRYSSWAVAIRTRLIDDYVLECIASGVDTVLNLGAGLDARPYRMDLPTELRWVEVDHPYVVAHKNEVLRAAASRCRLERFGLDLADGGARCALLEEVARVARNVLVLTEGVVPYLVADQVKSLAADLLAHPVFQTWILEYFAPTVSDSLRGGRLRRKMRNAPFQFAPANWSEFFAACGWQMCEIRYLGEMSRRFGRPVPLPWWVSLLRAIRRTESFDQMVGYVLLSPKSTQS
jgi:methyltransferase (TIGR00027 family)